jgi:hypothetical protein
VSDETEAPEIVYGRMLEAANIAGYAFSRTMEQLEYLLAENRWRGLGFGHVNEFVRTLDLSPFKVHETRPELVLTIKALQPEVSNRAIAEAIGVDEGTVRNDQREPAENSAPERKKRKRTKGATDDAAENSAPGPEPYNNPSNPMAPRELMADDVTTSEVEVGEEPAATTTEPTVSLEDAWREAYPEFVHPGIPRRTSA